SHMRAIGNALCRLGISCSFVEWADAPPKGDAYDFIAAGGDVADLLTRAAPFEFASPLPFRRIADYLRGAGAEPDYIVAPYLASGTVNVIHGDAKVGKTTLIIVGIVRSALLGTDFLGKPARQGPVVYLTEEGPATFARAVH